MVPTPMPTTMTSYAKGTARPDSDVDIALFILYLDLQDIGGTHMDLESAFGRKVDPSICPPDDFVEKIKKHWIPINLQRGTAMDDAIDTGMYLPTQYFTSLFYTEGQNNFDYLRRRVGRSDAYF
jgi:hypothetical protein